MKTFAVFFIFIFLSVTLPYTAQRENLKVKISARGDTITLKFFQPYVDTKLEGYILGYGSSMFSRQFIQLPEGGEPYETEIDAEPKYLIAVQPAKSNEVKKKCTGKVDLAKPLNLVIGSVTNSSVMLSWGTILKTPYTETYVEDCLEEDGQYTVRYREDEKEKEREKEKSPKWNYQSCPTTHTVIDNLKPDTDYEFGVRADTRDASGEWSPPVTHNTAEKVTEKPLSPRNQLKPVRPIMTAPRVHVPPKLVRRNRTQDRALPTLRNTSPPRLEKTTLGRVIWNNSSISMPFSQVTTAVQKVGPRHQPAPLSAVNQIKPHPFRKNTFQGKTRGGNGERHKGLLQSKKVQGSGSAPPSVKKSNLVGKFKEKEKVIDLKKEDPIPVPKLYTSTTTKTPANKDVPRTTTLFHLFNDSNFDTGDNSSVFSHVPSSKVDNKGKERFTAPHVIYKTDKHPDEPCSITHSLSFFPEEEVSDINVTAPPRNPPSNLTVVTVEGCPSFIILDWEKADNETTEYEVTTSTKGPHGDEVSVLTTNQTHTAVENLKPESSYEFKVTPKNELGSGPTSQPVTFSTESADPRVSDHRTSKNAIWSSYSFKTESYSECSGRQYVKRTWYRKFVGIQLCNSLRYKIYLSDSLNGKFYDIGDLAGNGEDHCQFVDSFLDGRTGSQLPQDQLPRKKGYYRAMRQEPVSFGDIGGGTHINYASWYECGTSIPGKW